MNPVADINGPLRIDAVVTPSGGTIGMMHCPGRRGLDEQSRQWTRSLAADLAAIRSWQADGLMSLIEAHEFATLGVPEFAKAVGYAGLSWHHVPIPDMQPPHEAALAAWAQSGPAILAILRDGGRVAVHCAAGLGRTGTITAKILVALGVPAQLAITQVRAVRPGTIETSAQEQYVRHGASLVID